MPIRILPTDVATKIAAGEVVERPASVVKELLENALDAGADDVGIDVLQGGRRLVRVSDNGSGIPADEVDIAFARHATSKLQTAEDLFRIETLGFRGEALASIAAVSRLTLTTRVPEEDAGTLTRLVGGVTITQEPRARPAGTTVSVENLFFNTPARLKFLRRDPTEVGHIARLVTSYALAYPGTRFSLRHNDRLMARTLGSGEPLDVLVALYGLDVAEQMMALDEPPDEGDRIRVWGYIGGPELHRANRQSILFFVNHRWIQDSSLSYAVTEAYRTLLPQRRYPMAVLHIQVPPEEVDVNIHPTKREVRFRHDRQVLAAVQRSVRATLLAQRPVPSLRTIERSIPPWSTGDRQGARYLSAEQSRLALELHGTGGRTPIADESSGRLTTTPSGERLPMLRVLGQVALTYIIAEGPGGMYLIDQHAAHERIRFEEIVAQRDGNGIVSQELLDPLTVDLDPERAASIEEHLTLLASYGLEIIPFGGTTFLVKRVPATLVGGNIPVALSELVDSATQPGAQNSWEEQTLIMVACHTAIRAGQALSSDEMRNLVRRLEQSQLPHTCPHGRPTIIHLSQAQLEREFGRR